MKQHLIASEYTQVFTEKYGFVPNLSILDLLFNEGPNSYTHLKAGKFTKVHS